MTGVKKFSGSLLFIAAIAYSLAAILQVQTLRAHAQSNSINPWWPQDGAHMKDVQPFKTQIEGMDVGSYDMYWQVDGGQLNSMYNSYQDYQHKEAVVDLKNWTWRGQGPYNVNFVAKQGGNVIAQRNVQVYVDNGMASVQVVTSQPVVSSNTFVAVKSASVGNSGLYVDPNSNAKRQANEWRSSRPSDAGAMDILASTPTATWIGNWNGDVQGDVKKLVDASTAQGTSALFVAYDIPGRDCGGYSAGGSNSPDGYRSWIRSVAAGIGSRKATVILEPDALAQITCLSAGDQQTRLSLLSDAINVLKSNGNTKVYLDGAHAGWVDPNTMAGRMNQANITKADGFSVNVSNFDGIDVSTTYGTALSRALGGKHFVMDTARNGNGSSGEWCNPSGRAIGKTPTFSTGNSLIDAYLWLKTPGESDGNCNGGPNAGVWWPDYALGLVRNAH